VSTTDRVHYQRKHYEVENVYHSEGCHDSNVEWEVLWKTTVVLGKKENNYNAYGYITSRKETRIVLTELKVIAQ